MRVILILSGIVLLILGSSTRNLACDCVTLSEEESFSRAESVFIGEAIRRDESTSGVTFTFLVKKSLKGKNATEISIVGRNTNCDFSFNVGWDYVVYARTLDNELISGTCFGTAALGIAAEGLRVSQPPAPAPFLEYWKMMVGASVFILLLAGLLARRMWHRAA
ncbi:MAG: hypothetical protein ND895_01965 [Pyrinomonadaceae bacterium]|nr:hypothetical protein [Pyrinomonadaceae bacterium]